MEVIYVFLSLIGFILLVYLAIKFLCLLFRLFFPFFIFRPKNLHQLAGAKWALITGATDGIGKSHAQELSNRGFSILLISRSADKLKAVSEEIRAKKLKSDAVKWIAFDFRNPNIEAYEKEIFREIQDLDIGILVNNVGVIEALSRFHNYPGGCRKISEELIVDTMPHTILTAFVLKQMVARKRGIIINISSIAALHPMFHWALYGSIKQYLARFSEILRKDYKGTGITIQTIFPGWTNTKMAWKLKHDAKSGFFFPTPGKFVQSALRTVGHVNETTGYFAHQLEVELASLMPNFLLDLLLKKQFLKMEREAGKA